MPQQDSIGFAAGEHPDENLLCAFAENALTRRERQNVAAHLAGCARCRECLAIASAAAPLPQQSTASVSWRPAWWWGAAAAAAACSVFGVVWFLQRPVRQQAEVRPVIDSTRLSVTPSSVAPQPPTAQATAPQKRPVHSHARAFVPPHPAAAPAPAMLDESVQPRQAIAARDGAPNADASAAKQSVIGGIAGANVPAPPPPPASATLRPPELQTFVRSDGAHPGAAETGMRMKKAKPAAEAPLRALNLASVLQPVWSVSPSGQVQRSFDNGATWQTLPIDPATTFRAVTSSGSEVWAGGSGGALFHSTDNGANWQRIEVRAEGATPSGAVTAIDASGVPLVQVTTSSGERWTSRDAGQTWKKE